LVLYGTVLSWEGRHDAARAALERVLRLHPTHHDALRAAIHLELWADRPARAEELARRGLDADPAQPDLQLLRVRALAALGRGRDSDDALAALLRAHPDHAEARALRDRRRAERRAWQVAAGYTYDGFDDGREDWHEMTLSLKRRLGFGSLLFKYYRARHFGFDGDQFELHAFPRLRDGTWLELAAAASPQGDLYPSWRLQADLYQSLGRGFEASLGFRHLGFDDSVQIVVATLSKYHGDWMLLARTFVTPDEAGVSASFHGAVRRYFRDGSSYLGLRYGYGASREEINNANDLEIATLASHSVGADIDVDLGRVSLGASAAYHRGERHDRTPLSNWSFGTRVALRF
jgi:YaiO family outer membrane protein